MQPNATIIAHGNQKDRNISIINLRTLRFALIKKHGSITTAARDLNVMYNHFSDVINGRSNIIHIVSAIQHDLDLTDIQVLEFWPLLRTWPRESRRVML